MAAAGPTGAGGNPTGGVAIQAGLGQMVNPGGMNALLARGKDKFGKTKAWEELWKCEVIYAKNVNNWIGQKGTSYYELSLVLDQPLFKPVADPKLTEEEKAVMTAAQARYASSKQSVILARSLTTKNAELTNRNNQLSAELGKTLALLGREKVKTASLEHENRKLLLENEDLKKQFEDRKTKYDWKGLKSICFWVFLATLLAGFITGTNADCTLVEMGSPFKIGYETYKQLCMQKDSLLPEGAFDREALALECAEHMDYMDCKQAISNAIAGKKKFPEAIYEVLRIEEAKHFIQSTWNFAVHFSLAYPLCMMVALALTRDKKHAIMSAGLAYIARFCNLRLLPFSIVLTYAPIETAIAGCYYGLGFVGIPMITFFHWAGLMIKAIFVPDENFIGTRISYALSWSLALPFWLIIQDLMSLVEIPIEAQIVITLVLFSLTFGLRYLTGVVTVTEPDGTVKKYKRITTAKSAFGTISAVLFERAKAIRGVIPSFPNRSENVVMIEVDNDGGAAGVGFRLGNYLYTAGHVIGEAKTAKVTWKGMTTSTKVLGQIELPLFTDTLAKLELPKPFQQLPVFRLAKTSDNDYVQMVSFDNNFQNVVTFTGWASIDGDYLNAPFETYPGTSGSPIINRDGRLLAVHFGSNAVVSQGFVVIRLFATEPVVRQCATSDEIEDRITQRVMAGLRLSHAVIMQQLEEQREEILQLKQQLAFFTGEEESCILDEKKKGKTKKTVRGLKHKTKGISKAAFMKQKILTEEEYRRLEEEGFSKEEIKDIVDNLREQAWLDYLNQQDEEDDDNWAEQMAEDDRINQQIDKNIEQSMEDRGEWYAQKRITYKERAMLRFIHNGRKQHTVTVDFPDGLEQKAEELFDRVVTTEDLPEGETSEAMLSTPNKVMYVAGKALNFKPAKIQPNVTFMKSGVTQIEEQPEGQVILKSKTTTKIEEKAKEDTQQPEQQQPPQQVQPIAGEKKKHQQHPKPQRKKTGAKAKCLECGETFVEKQDFHVCKTKN
nr:ORF1a [Avian astrovirus]